MSNIRPKIKENSESFTNPNSPIAEMVVPLIVSGILLIVGIITIIVGIITILFDLKNNFGDKIVIINDLYKKVKKKAQTLGGSNSSKNNELRDGTRTTEISATRSIF